MSASTKFKNENLYPAVMTGISMAPWLLPGDGLLIDEHFPLEQVRVGDVLAIRHEPSASTAVHRVVGTRDSGEGLMQMSIKGDRNRDCDALDENWQYVGRVCRRHRGEKWKDLSWGRLLAFLSRHGLYPGQLLPAHWTRTRLIRFFGFQRSRR